MKYPFIIAVMLLILIIGIYGKQVASNKAQIQEGKGADSDLTSTSWGDPISTREPMTFQYYQNVINSTEPFSYLYFAYSMRTDEQHHNVRTQTLEFNSPAIFSDPAIMNYANQYLSNIINYEAYYGDGETQGLYKYEIPISFINPIYQIISQNNSYYFNASEYDAEPSKEMSVEFEFGHLNYITLSFYLYDDKGGFPRYAKTFCKGWDPGDDPPAELVPLINYLETAVIPEMRLHPYGPGS